MTPPVVRRTGPFAVSAVVFAASAAVALGLAGCAGAPAPSASPAASTAVAVPSPAPTASAPAAIALVPGGTAEQNLPYFDQVNHATLAANPNAQGRDFIDALVAAGFQKSDMQVTVDTTTIGLKANSIQFSVRMGDTCLIGQNGADAGGYWSEVVPVLSTGTCLVGQTRAIDW
ncbi:DUF6993 domain-containing protein [Leifsonia shinshuensis]|uniref:DUF6993 domain-containing protein n=1 Tax=Leifsonia shinshuensis TaxID=150026 RepID=UPI00285EDE6C|nr:hypothetical protein [Leifsonia shinshuensis]MDR6970317.1 hypothetical protein [Leifsonia shinshuensis]